MKDINTEPKMGPDAEGVVAWLKMDVGEPAIAIDVALPSHGAMDDDGNFINEEGGDTASESWMSAGVRITPARARRLSRELDVLAAHVLHEQFPPLKAPETVRIPTDDEPEGHGPDLEIVGTDDWYVTVVSKDAHGISHAPQYVRFCTDGARDHRRTNAVALLAMIASGQKERAVGLARSLIDSLQDQDAEEIEIALWDAINDYAVACGGNPSKGIYGNIPRQKAVARINKLALQRIVPKVEP